KLASQECNRASPGGQYMHRRLDPALLSQPRASNRRISRGNRAMRVNLSGGLSIAILAGLAAGAALRATYAAGHPASEEVWSTKKVMDKAHLGKQSLLSVVQKDLRQAEPDWKSDERNLAEMIRLMSMLTRQKPPRGSQDAWDKLVDDYVQAAKTARQNVNEHRLQPTRAALEKLVSTCDECHDNHGIK